MIVLPKGRTTNEFIEEMRKINPDIEILGEYRTARIKINVGCKICGNKWSVVPYYLSSGGGCPKCRGVKLSKRFRKSHDDFIEELKEANPNVTVVSKYKNAKTKVNCYCEKHGHWKASPEKLLQGNGCPECGRERTARKKRKTHEEFINEINEENDHIIVLGEYKADNVKVSCLCRDCEREWMAVPSMILGGRGCPHCKLSRGEREIAKVLDGEGLRFTSQCRFEECKMNKTLPFDFYLPDLNIAIEYDGRQHFFAIEYFGGEKGLERTRKSDRIKSEFCLNNGIKLIRIPYTINDVKGHLKSKLKDYENMKVTQ